MKKTLVWIGIIAIIALWGISAYNGLVNKDEAVTAAWGQVENNYQRRADLIPNLVDCVKQYDIYRLDPERMRYFESFYAAWRRALARHAPEAELRECQDAMLAELARARR